MEEKIGLKIVGYMEGFKQTNRVFDTDGIAPAVLSRDFKDPPRILVEDNECEDTMIMPN